MSAAREEILARVRAAIDPGEPQAEVTHAYRTGGSLDTTARVALLVERLLQPL